MWRLRTSEVYGGTYQVSSGAHCLLLCTRPCIYLSKQTSDDVSGTQKPKAESGSKAGASREKLKNYVQNCVNAQTPEAH